MTARTLLILFDSIYLIALASWVGSVLFLSFGIAPIIFKILDPESAAKFVRALFPRYYLWGAISGAIALPAAIAVPLAFPYELRSPWVGVQALAIIAGVLLMLYAGNSLTSQINAARDAGPPQKARFDRLHRRSVHLNAVVLLIGLSLLVGHACRPRPSTSGIIELPPAQRAQAEADWLRKGPFERETGR